jgi:type VI secretion system protein VasG
LNEVAARCTEVESGARNVDNILSNTMLPDLSRQILTQLAGGETSNRVTVSVKDGALTYAWDVAEVADIAQAEADSAEPEEESAQPA